MSTGAERRLDAAALERIRHTEVVSAGALERYARCPVRWLVESQLAPAPLEPAPEPMVRGSFMHASSTASSPGCDAPLGSRPALAGCDRAAAGGDRRRAAQAPGVGLDGGVREALVSGLEADLRRYLELEAADGCDYVPRHTELKFGIGESRGAPGAGAGGGAARVCACEG